MEAGEGLVSHGSQELLEDGTSNAGPSGTPAKPPAQSRVDRLLQERIRRNRSQQQFDYDEAQYEGPLDMYNDASTAERLVVVANRLPVTCSKDASGMWQLQVSAGGLVSALKGVTTYRTIWIGWPGIWVKPGKDREILTGILMEEGCIPVWIDPTLLDMYYNGFCNSVLWQLFHYVPLNIDNWQKMSEQRAMQMQWQAYQVANQKFADVVLEHYQANDIMWVQDYHLMLLPSLLKAVVPKMKVGFFLHTPFPSSEMYRTLPVREEVLRAVLGADLIGFHTYDYARHFISSCTRILGLEGTPEGVENANGTITRVGTFPIGIDPERFTRALEGEEVQSHVAKLLNRYAGRKIMLGVDRLDMVKGIPQKLLAFEKFLEEHAEWRDKVLLVQIAVPSRTDVPEYQKLRSMVHEIVGRINGAFGTLTYVPIYHLDTSLSFTELCALYAVTDVAMVTSLRDGMNLVSYEYVACQSDNAGVLVLSEFAGAAQSLGAGAILVNPWNITDMAQAIEDALCMSEEERRERHRQNYMHVQTHTAQNWADTFISELNDTHIEADLRMRHAPPPLDMQECVAAYQASGRRLIVLGYNATLTTNVDVGPGGRAGAGAAGTRRQYSDHLKALAKVNPKVLSSIQELCQDPANVVAIFSGSETHKLEEIFGSLPVWLAAENGVFVRPPPSHLPVGAQRPGMPVWRQLFDGIHREWMESVQLVFDYFCERTPRSFVEVRETSLVWNYKHADVEFGRIQARDLLQHLWTGPISNAPVEIIQGGKSVEVRPVGVTKGLATQRMLALMAEVYGAERVGFDFILCIGHLLGRDENMYSFFEGQKIDGTGATGGTRDRTNSHPAVPGPGHASGSLPVLPPGVGIHSPGSSSFHHHHHHQPPHHQLNMQQQVQLQMQQQAVAAGAVLPTMAARRNAQLIAQLQQHQQEQEKKAAVAAAVASHQPRLSVSPPQSQLPSHPGSRNITGHDQPVVGLQQQQQQQGQPEPSHGFPASRAQPSATHSGVPGSTTDGGATAGGLPQPRGMGSTSSFASASAPPTPASGLPGLPPWAQNNSNSGQDQQQRGNSSFLLPKSSLGAAGGAGGMVGGVSAAFAAASQPGGQPGRAGSHGLEGGSSSLRNGGGGGGYTPAIYLGHAPSESQVVPTVLPPRHLYTCTVGRNRSKARYALGAASEVADLLDAIVQQAIYHRDPPMLPAQAAGGQGLPGLTPSMSRIESFSSTEPLSPDSLFTLINSWRNFNRGGSSGAAAIPGVLAEQLSSSLPLPQGPGGSLPSAAALAQYASGNASSAAMQGQVQGGLHTSNSSQMIGHRTRSGMLSMPVNAAASGGLSAGTSSGGGASGIAVGVGGTSGSGGGVQGSGTMQGGYAGVVPGSVPLSVSTHHSSYSRFPVEPVPEAPEHDGTDGSAASSGTAGTQPSGTASGTATPPGTTPSARVLASTALAARTQSSPVAPGSARGLPPMSPLTSPSAAQQPAPLLSRRSQQSLAVTTPQQQQQQGRGVAGGGTAPVTPDSSRHGSSTAFAGATSISTAVPGSGQPQLAPGSSRSSQSPAQASATPSSSPPSAGAATRQLPSAPIPVERVSNPLARVSASLMDTGGGGTGTAPHSPRLFGTSSLAAAPVGAVTGTPVTTPPPSSLQPSFSPITTIPLVSSSSNLAGGGAGAGGGPSAGSLSAGGAAMNGHYVVTPPGAQGLGSSMSTGGLAMFGGSGGGGVGAAGMRHVPSGAALSSGMSSTRGSSSVLDELARAPAGVPHSLSRNALGSASKGSLKDAALGGGPGGAGGAATTAAAVQPGLSALEDESNQEYFSSLGQPLPTLGVVVPPQGAGGTGGSVLSPLADGAVPGAQAVRVGGLMRPDTDTVLSPSGIVHPPGSLSVRSSVQGAGSSAANLLAHELSGVFTQVDVGPSISQQGSPVPSEDVNAANGSMRGISPPLPHINTL